ncbi:MAG: YggS family pyridoxal phosphate-dependent enzyme [Saprospirales bacterium]|nr:MAG: YggS family pyridoxal phosphate-dependent enzyme [Saprospirales bacterium]
MVRKERYFELLDELKDSNAELVAVSKTHSVEKIKALYELGHRDFGENRVAELLEKAPLLPGDIRWHFIGNLQSKKVKNLIPVPWLIHSVNRPKLLRVIQQAAENNEVVCNILVQLKIAEEDTKSGFDYSNAEESIDKLVAGEYPNIQLRGLMGMATFTDDMNVVRDEFSGLQEFHQKLRSKSEKHREHLKILSTGMSGDYKVGLECGSNMVRIGSLIFGERNY